MTDPTHNPPKKLSGLMAGRTFTVGKAQHSYEHYIDLTSKLFKRSYMATHKLVEGMTLEQIIHRYDLCTKHAGTMPGDVKWWWLRKSENTKGG